MFRNCNDLVSFGVAGGGGWVNFIKIVSYDLEIQYFVLVRASKGLFRLYKFGNCVYICAAFERMICF